MVLVQRLLLVAAVLVGGSNVYAEDEEDAEAVPSKYMPIEPALITNFGGPGRLRYMKVEVTLRVNGEEGEAQVTRHMPNIKDTLLTLFAVQTSESIGTAQGKDQLRKSALKEVNGMLAEEDSESHVTDLLFTSFVAHQ